MNIKSIPYLPLSFQKVPKIQRGKEIIPKELQITKYAFDNKIYFKQSFNAYLLLILHAYKT